MLDDFDTRCDVEFSFGERGRKLLKVPLETLVIELLALAELQVRTVTIQSDQSGWLSVDSTKCSNDTSTTSDIDNGVDARGDGI
jgi:hypothetical protein